jgi:predicted DNA-binding transcriptional regulator YafY
MKDRKNIPKNALARLYFIDREISAGKYPNTKTLAEAYETGTATISRDIEFMRDMLNAPIEYDYTLKGYYYTKKTYRLPAVYSTAENILALGMAKNMLHLYKNTPIYDAAKQLMDTVTTPLEEDDNSHWYEDRIIVPPIPSTQFSPDIWDNVCEGLKKNRVLDIEYCSTLKSGYFPRRVHPYQLLFDNGSWYLYAFTEECGGIRMYGLSRMRKARLSDETFSFPASADFRVRFDGSYFGAYSGEKKYRFRIAFFNDGAMRIKERLWASDQKIKKTQDGVILSFTSAQYGKVRELVLSNGRDALPLEPERLVRDWQENLRDMQKRSKSLKK